MTKIEKLVRLKDRMMLEVAMNDIQYVADRYSEDSAMFDVLVGITENIRDILSDGVERCD